MKEVFEDVTGVLNGAPTLSEIGKAGGVHVVRDMTEYPKQRKTPNIILTDGGSRYIRMSSKKRKARFFLQVHIVVRHFSKEGIIVSDPYKRGAVEWAKKIRKVLDMNRIDRKYNTAFIISDEPPELVDTGIIFILEKLLSFEYTRIE